MNCYSVKSTVINNEHVVVAESMEDAIKKYCDYWHDDYGNKRIKTKDIQSIKVIENNVIY